MREKRNRHRRRTRPGAAPGTLNIDPGAPAPVLRAIAFGPEGMDEMILASPAEIPALRETWPVVWINVDGTGDAEVIQSLGDLFGLHRLVLEDVVNLHQRAKMEDHEGYIFVVANMITPGSDLQTEQVGLFFGEGWVLTFQERAGDSFDPVRERLRSGKGRIRKANSDYLAYALLDAIVDHYFPVLESFGARVEAMEEEISENPTTETLHRIRQSKTALIRTRRVLWPLKEALHGLLRDGGDLVTEETRIYLRDCQDHVASLLDLVEGYREIVGGMQEACLSHASHRMNEIMKVLTIIATIFIPLTFVAGIYGMNFTNMPELTSSWGYPTVLAVMAAATAGLVLLFRRKGWL